MLSALFAASVVSQTPDCPVYDRCKTDADNNLQATCSLVLEKNATWYQQCLCYYHIEKGRCYVQCPENEAVQTEKRNYQGAIDSVCAAANMNPNGTLSPGPWHTLLPSPVSVWTPPTSTPSSTLTASPTVKVNAAVGAWTGLLGLLALIVVQ